MRNLTRFIKDSGKEEKLYFSSFFNKNMNMKDVTLKDIIEKYPKIFAPYEGNPGGVNWTGVPKGWLPIIYDLCGAIQNYIDHYRRSALNPSYIEGSKWESGDITTHKYVQVSPNQVTCVQMKEKFGGLRFYTDGHDDIVDGMIQYAEYLCDNTCEVCGSRENLGNTTGWITVCCESCYSSGKSARGEWKPKI